MGRPPDLGVSSPFPRGPSPVPWAMATRPPLREGGSYQKRSHPLVYPTSTARNGTRPGCEYFGLIWCRNRLCRPRISRVQVVWNESTTIIYLVVKVVRWMDKRSLSVLERAKIIAYEPSTLSFIQHKNPKMVRGPDVSIFGWFDTGIGFVDIGLV